MGVMFRYEHDDGKGPYTSRSISRYSTPCYDEICDMNMTHCDDYKGHPGPYKDCYPYFSWDYNKNSIRDHIFGCASIDKLLDWFKGYNHALLKAGFKIYKYESDEVFHGKKQSTLRISDATTKELVSGVQSQPVSSTGIENESAVW